MVALDLQRCANPETARRTAIALVNLSSVVSVQVSGGVVLCVVLCVVWWCVV